MELSAGKIESGRVVFDKKKLALLIIPIIIEQLLTAAMGVADTLMVSAIGEAAVSGVSLVDSINLLLANIFAALATGGTVIASQYLGRNDKDNARKAAEHVFLVTLVISAALMLLVLFLRNGILSLLFGKIEDDVRKNALVYFLFTGISYPFLAQFNTCSAQYRAMGNSRLPMLISVAMNVINIGGNALLIFVFKMGAAGAAISTLTSRVVGALVICIMLFFSKGDINIRGIFRLKIHFGMIKNILAIGIPTGIENSIFQIGRLLVQSIVSSFGTAVIAANAVANSIVGVAILPGMGVGIALVTVTGYFVGAGDYKNAKKYIIKLTGLSYAIVIVVEVLMFIFRYQLIGLYGIGGTAAKLAAEFMTIHVVGTSLLWPSSFTIPNGFRAANDVKFTMIVSLISMWVLRVGLGYVLSYYTSLGEIAVWISMMADWLARAVIYIWRLFSNTWMSHQILKN